MEKTISPRLIDEIIDTVIDGCWVEKSLFGDTIETSIAYDKKQMRELLKDLLERANGIGS